MKAYGGAAGYRPRVQSAYFKRVYHHSWQASPDNIGKVIKESIEIQKISQLLRGS